MPSKERGQQLGGAPWDRVRPPLPPRPPQPGGGRPLAGDEACVAGIGYQVRNAARWNAMPDCFPSGVTCWRRHRDGARAGVWPKVRKAVLAELAAAEVLDAAELFLDATFAASRRGGRASAGRAAASA